MWETSLTIDNLFTYLYPGEPTFTNYIVNISLHQTTMVIADTFGEDLPCSPLCTRDIAQG
jgi:hypothetical protein